MCGRFDLDAGLPEVQWITKGFDLKFKTGEVFPTTGFYEWKTDPGSKKKVRYRFSEPDQPITWIAGFFNTFKDEQRFTMLTTAANEAMEEYHDRMPVILHTDERLDWLEGNNISDYLKRVPPELNSMRMG